MACITLMAQPLAMATTQLARMASYEVSAPWLEQITERQPLRMNWVVVPDKNGACSLRMQWKKDPD